MTRPIGLSTLSRPMFIETKPSLAVRITQITGVVICVSVVAGGVWLKWNKQNETNKELATLRAEVLALKYKVGEKDAILQSINRLCLIDLPKKKGTKP
jgi:negative regulator of sigma E activity